MRKLIICLLISVIYSCTSIYGQSLNTISEGNLKNALIKALSIDGIQKDTITIRKNYNSITSGMMLTLGEMKNKPFVVRHLSDKYLHKYLVDDYLELGHIEVSSRLILMNYIKRSKGKVVKILLKKNARREWVIVDKEIYEEGSLRFNDFLYDTIRKEKLKNKN